MAAGRVGCTSARRGVRRLSEIKKEDVAVRGYIAALDKLKTDESGPAAGISEPPGRARQDAGSR